jgi:hypothetical protein
MRSDVGIIIPVWKPNPAWLQQAVKSALGQGVVIVEEDAFGKGPCGPRNRAVESAKAQGCRYIAPLDCDDIMPEGRIAAQAEFLDEHPDVAIVGGFVDLMREDGTIFGRHKPKPGAPVHGACMYRIEWWDRIGGYDAKSRGGGDSRFLLAIVRKRGKLARLNRVTLLRRIHPNSLSHRRGLERSLRWWEESQR